MTRPPAKDKVWQPTSHVGVPLAKRPSQNAMTVKPAKAMQKRTCSRSRQRKNWSMYKKASIAAGLTALHSRSSMCPFSPGSVSLSGGQLNDTVAKHFHSARSLKFDCYIRIDFLHNVCSAFEFHPHVISFRYVLVSWLNNCEATLEGTGIGAALFDVFLSLLLYAKGNSLLACCLLPNVANWEFDFPSTTAGALFDPKHAPCLLCSKVTDVRPMMSRTSSRQSSACFMRKSMIWYSVSWTAKLIQLLHTSF